MNLNYYRSRAGYKIYITILTFYLKEWRDKKTADNKDPIFVSTRQDLLELDIKKYKAVFGNIFSLYEL